MRTYLNNIKKITDQNAQWVYQDFGVEPAKELLYEVIKHCEKNLEKLDRGEAIRKSAKTRQG